VRKRGRSDIDVIKIIWVDKKGMADIMENKTFI
jgi:hypothetical protein